MKRKQILSLTLLLIPVLGCVHNDEFNNPAICEQDNIQANISITELKQLFTGKTIKIQEDLIIEGYVISSDRSGNIYGSVHFQDKPENPNEGLQIELDITDSHLYYPIGSKIYIKLKGLYLGVSKQVYKVGGLYTGSFNNVSVGRLPAAAISDHVLTSCNDAFALKPSIGTIEEISDMVRNSLVTINQASFKEDEQGLVFALPEETTKRHLINCNGNSIEIVNSGYSDFKDDLIPVGSGSVTGILTNENDKVQLVIRDPDDIRFTATGLDCGYIKRSDKIIISEIADPENTTTTVNVRFIELTNLDTEAVSLDGWALRRYTNDNTGYSSVIDLSGIILTSGQSTVIAANAENFRTVYGFEPNLEGGSSGAAASNGDDTMELVNLDGTVIDIFGVIGEDGTGTDHDFENGRAARKTTVIKGNSVFDAGEWVIETPKVAPEDFNPGVR